jgi:SAM-dependent methyltransferase
MTESIKFKFETIANSYNQHVRNHIPNYDIVIDKTIKLCKLYNYNSSIVDFGSANGITLEKLYTEGFRNLYGIEPVDALRELSNKSIADYSKTLPCLKFDVIIANWVLHFIKNKEDTLRNFYNCLDDNGILIISEKVSSNEIIKKFYYDFKRNNNVSEEEIFVKEKSLAGVMHLETIDWYFTVLNEIGFDTIEIIDGAWGFITLMVKK